MLNRAGIWWWAFGIVLDKARKDIEWDPAEKVEFIHENSHKWLEYRGLWSPNGIDSLPDKGYWNKEWHSSNPWYRRCMCCCVDHESCQTQHKTKWGH